MVVTDIDSTISAFKTIGPAYAEIKPDNSMVRKNLRHIKSEILKPAPISLLLKTLLQEVAMPENTHASNYKLTLLCEAVTTDPFPSSVLNISIDIRSARAKLIQTK